MKKLVDLYFDLLSALVTVLAGALIVPVTLQIVSRYTDVMPTLMWTEEAARFCLVWVIMLGATIAVREGLHFDIDLLPTPKTALGGALARITVDVAIAATGIAFLWIGSRYALDALTEVSEITELRMIWMYVAFPVSAGGWILFSCERIALTAQPKAGLK